MGTPPFPLAPGSAAIALPVELVFDGAFYQASGGGGGGAPYGATPCGYEQVASLVTAVGLGAIPNSATFAVVQVEGADVRWRDDGSAPTASVGMILPGGSQWTFSGDLTVVQFINTAAGTAKLNVSFYK